MRKMILTGMLIFTLIFGFVCVKKGITFPGKIYSYAELKAESDIVNTKMDALTRMKSTTYVASESALQTSVKKHLEIKTNYDKISSTKSEEQKEKALLGQDYDIGYLWVKLGNYAVKNNCDLTLEVSQEKDATEDDKYVLCDLKFETTSGYDGITNFIEEIGRDTELSFIPENLKLYSKQKEIKVLDPETGQPIVTSKLMLITEFYKTDIPISKASLLKIENQQTLEEEKQAAQDAAKNNTTNTTKNTTNTTNTTKNTTNTAKNNTTNTTKNTTNTTNKAN